MKRLLTFITVLLIWITLSGSESGLAKPVYLPQSVFIIQRQGYTLAYDGRNRNAIWVYEILKRESFEVKKAERKKCRFKADESLPAAIRASVDDYHGSGYQLGHLCPFADCRGCQAAAEETFILSNICPQAAQFNQGLWRKLEEHLRSLALNYSTLHIITLPLYLPKDRCISYAILGKHNVAVPTHFCKVVFAEKGEGTDVFAYILPNTIIPDDLPLDHFKTTVDEVEKASGVIFPYHPNLSSAK